MSTVPAPIRLLGLCLALAASGLSHAEPMNLRQAYEAALQNDPNFRAALAARDAGKEEAILGRSQLLPTVSANYTLNRGNNRSALNEITTSTESSRSTSASDSRSTTEDKTRNFFGESTSQRVTESDNETRSASSLNGYQDQTEIEGRKYSSTSAALQLRQPLFNLGAMAAYRQGRALSAASEARFKALQQDLMVRLAEAYAGALFAEEGKRLALSQLETLREQQTSNERLLASGEGTLTDVLETRAKFELAQAQLLEADDAVYAARNRLIAMTGLPAGPLAPLNTEPDTRSSLASTPEEWHALARQNNGLLESLRFQVDAAFEEVKKADSGHYPRLDLVASMGRENYAANVNPLATVNTTATNGSSESTSTASSTTTTEGALAPTSSQSSTSTTGASRSNTASNAQQNLATRRHSNNHIVGIEFNLPLFAGGSVSARTRQLAARLVQSQAEMDARTAEIELELNRQFRLQQSTAQRARALLQAVASSRTAIDATQKSMVAGVRTNLDVLGARERLSSAERELANARYSHVLAFLRLRFNAGVLAEADLLQLTGR
jgi:protease secretion system outer membrane protein